MSMRLSVSLLGLLSMLVMAGCGEETTPPRTSGPAKPTTQPSDARPAASTPPTKATKVTLQLNWKPEPQFGGFYAARDGGIFTKHGLDVDVVAGGVGTPTVQMVGAGKVEFGVVSADEVLLARAAGNEVVALFAAYQTCPQGLMVHASRGFKEIGDIFRNEGTVAMQKGLPYASLIEKQFGFDKVKIVPSPGGDLTVLQSNREFAQQCFVTSEPIAARKMGLEVKTFLVAEVGYNPYTTVLATRSDYLKAHPDIVQAMVAAVRDGWRAYLDDPAPTNAAMQKLNPSMDAETFIAAAEAQKSLIENDDTKANGLGTMSKERWETLGQQLFDLKVVSEKPKTEECFRQ